MRITVIGPGRIGGNAARLLARAGHDVSVSFSRDPDRLAAVAAELDPAITAVPVTADAVAEADVVVLSVPWSATAQALAAAGSLAGRVVIEPPTSSAAARCRPRGRPRRSATPPGCRAPAM